MDKVFLNSFYAKEYPVVVMDKNGCKITMVTRPYDHVVYYKVEFGGKTDEVNHLVTALQIYNTIVVDKYDE
ncbi:MAG: hypothetical protein GOVbin631_66 [Prokaryotic dsDNA virus sp.]|nr:MAG: hypothetical protein GOVbin631_66 [Prokaryotic dsDNA virus sp.]